MTGTDLVVSRRATPVMNIDMTALDYDAYERGLDAIGGPRTQVFKGEQLTFKQGSFVAGYGDQAEEFDSLKLVVNYAYAVRAWRKFNGTYMEYGAMAMIGAGETLPSRNSMGDLDESEWPLAKFGSTKGEPEDPWRELVILMCRTKKGELFHFIADTVSKNIAFASLLRDIVTEARRKPGMLPVVEFTSVKAKNKAGEKFDAMECNIVDWVKVTSDDDPSNLFGTEDEGDGEGDEAPKTKAKGSKPKATRRTAAAAAKKAAVEDAEDDDDDADEGDEGEEDEAPKSKSKSSKPKAKAASKSRFNDDDEDDEDDDEEGEESKPAHKRRARRSGRFS